MKKTTFYIFSVLFLLIISCSKTVREQALNMKDVFPTQKNTDSTFVFDLDTIISFKNYIEKCEYYEEITHKKQYVRTQNNDIPLNINFFIKCHLPTFCIKEKNIIVLEGDFKEEKTLFFHEDEKVLSVKNFEEYLNKQLLNWGKDYGYSDSPDRSIILFRYRDLTKKSKERVYKALNTMSVSYFNFINSFQKKNIDSLKRVYPLQILLEKDFRLFDKKGNLIEFPPPPPPAPLEIVE